jgi:hypothetical protein
MRNPLLLAAAISLITGCITAPPSSTVSADQLIDEQIAVSASTLSQAQLRLHQTAAPAPSASPAVAVTTVTAAAAVKPAAPVVVMPAPAPAPKIVEVVQAHNGPSPAAQVVADALKPSALSKAGSTSAVPLAKPASTTLAVKSIASAPAPPVVLAKATPPRPVAEQWTMTTSDVTLRRALGKWAAKAGWQLVWEASVDVPINVTATFEGDFRTAVKRLFQSLSAADVNLTGMLYAGNRVLRVTESGRRAQ